MEWSGTRLYQPLTKRDQITKPNRFRGELFTYFQWVNVSKKRKPQVSSFLLSASRPLKYVRPSPQKSSASGLQSQKHKVVTCFVSVSGFDAVDIQAVSHNRPLRFSWRIPLNVNSFLYRSSIHSVRHGSMPGRSAPISRGAVLTISIQTMYRLEVVFFRPRALT